MQRSKLLWVSLLVIVLLATAACTESDLDDPDTGNVVLQVLGINNPAITGGFGVCTNTVPAVSCLADSDCPALEICNVGTDAFCTVTEWTAQLQNTPKTAQATTSPFNDVFIANATIFYSWPDGTEFSRTKTISATIKAGNTGSVSFFPISQGDIVSLGTTVDLRVVFNAEILDGTDITAEGGADLFIENCVPRDAP